MLDTDTDTDTDKNRKDTEAETELTRAPAVPIERRAEQLFQEVTGMVTIPGRDGRDLQKIIDLLHQYERDETKRRMSAAWKGWLQCVTQDGREYSRTNNGWLDYAIAGSVPSTSKPQPKSKEDSDVEKRRKYAQYEQRRIE